MRSLKTWTAVVSCAALLGCSNPADKAPSAKVGDASSPSGETTVPAGGKKFAFGPPDSKIGFVGAKKVGGSHDGEFNGFAGELVVADGKLAATSVEIQTDSMVTDDTKLTGHLKTADFFDVAQYPTATFQSTSIEPDGDNVEVTGNLTLHGVTKSISFPAKVAVADDKVTLTSEFSINRLDFKIQSPGATDNAIQDKVLIKLDIQATPA